MDRAGPRGCGLRAVPGRGAGGAARGDRAALRLGPRQHHRAHSAGERLVRQLGGIFPRATAAAAARARGRQRHGRARRGRRAAARGAAGAARRAYPGGLAPARRPVGRQLAGRRRRHTGAVRSGGLLWRPRDRPCDDAPVRRLRSRLLPRLPARRTAASRSRGARRPLQALPRAEPCQPVRRRLRCGRARAHQPTPRARRSLKRTVDSAMLRPGPKESAMADKNIKSILLEERSFPPPADFTARARIKPQDLAALRERARADHVGFWSELAARELTWHTPFTVRLDDREAPNYRWFSDGRLNASYNCLDVHLAERGHKTAVIFEGEPGDVRRLSYRELHAEVCRFANALKARGVTKGDRVIIYMPLVPEVLIAMHACNRIGAIHSVVFGGFSAPALKDRIEDTAAKLVITADGGWRGGHAVELKANTDEALRGGCASVKHVIVLKRTGKAVTMKAKRDLWWHDVIEGQSPACEPEYVEAEHPLYLLYTSGSTGRPKGIQHSTGGYLLGAKVTTQWVFDLRDEDVFWCTADVGWVTGHSYVAYGPLAAGATVVLYEGAPN